MLPTNAAARRRRPGAGTNTRSQAPGRSQRCRGRWRGGGGTDASAEYRCRAPGGPDGAGQEDETIVSPVSNQVRSTFDTRGHTYPCVQKPDVLGRLMAGGAWWGAAPRNG